jgi:hypothetical protein
LDQRSKLDCVGAIETCALGDKYRVLRAGAWEQAQNYKGLPGILVTHGPKNARTEQARL